MVELTKHWDLTPRNVAEALFDVSQDPFEVMKSLGRLAGDDAKDEILELKAPFTLEVDRGQSTKKEAVEKFTQVLEKNAAGLNLKH